MPRRSATTGPEVRTFTSMPLRPCTGRVYEGGGYTPQYHTINTYPHHCVLVEASGSTSTASSEAAPPPQIREVALPLESEGVGAEGGGW